MKEVYVLWLGDKPLDISKKPRKGYTKEKIDKNLTSKISGKIELIGFFKSPEEINDGSALVDWTGPGYYVYNSSTIANWDSVVSWEFARSSDEYFVRKIRNIEGYLDFLVEKKYLDNDGKDNLLSKLEELKGESGSVNRKTIIFSDLVNESVDGMLPYVINPYLNKFLRNLIAEEFSSGKRLKK